MDTRYTDKYSIANQQAVQSYEKVRTILEDTKAFKPEEISKTLALLQEKIDAKKADLQTYKDLGELSKSSYS